MMNRPDAGTGPDARLRTMRILWVIFPICIVQLFLVGWFIHPEADWSAGGAGNQPTVLYAAALLGLVSVAVSFAVKSAFFRRAAELQEPAQIQIGFIFAMALCEAAALLGMAALFITLSKYAYLLFALGALGQVLHFPRRDEVLAAYHKPVG